MGNPNAAQRPGLPLKPTLFILALTVAYLLCELAFNARLLDVVGGRQAESVHALEHYGRLLSGTAVALFVLQHLLTKRARSDRGLPHGLTIVFWCLLSVALTYGALKLVVDALVYSSSPQFRKASVNLVLVRSEMLSGRAQLAGLSDDPALYERPEGKAFVALFPALGALIWPHMERSIAPVKLELVKKSLHAHIGGAEAYYNGAYTKALKEAEKAYRGEIPEEAFAKMAQRESDKAWADYSARLRKRNWTPDSVPHRAKSQVAAQMNKEVGVPRHWQPNDRSTFHRAIANKLRTQLRNSPGSVYEDGRSVASGLSWPAYVSHAVIQRQLQSALELTPALAVRPTYASGPEFELSLYQPMLNIQARKELQLIDLPAEEYAADGQRGQAGLDAAQAVLVPPVVLLFSLLGAIAHLGKLCYQLSRIALMHRPASALTLWLPRLAPLAAFAVVAYILATSRTEVTESAPHQFLRNQALQAANAEGSQLRTHFTLGALHVAEVGQSLAYPINHAIRSQLLGGFQFGVAQSKER